MNREAEASKRCIFAQVLRPCHEGGYMGRPLDERGRMVSILCAWPSTGSSATSEGRAWREDDEMTLADLAKAFADDPVAAAPKVPSNSSSSSSSSGSVSDSTSE